MKKRFVMILALLVAYVAVFAAAGCTDADKNAEVSFSENYFVTYSDRSGRILIAARYGDEFYVKRSEALPNTYTEKAYYPVDGGWQVYIKHGERWNSYGTEDSLDDALADILGPVVEGMKSINSGSAEKTGKTSARISAITFLPMFSSPLIMKFRDPKFAYGPMRAAALRASIARPYEFYCSPGGGRRGGHWPPAGLHRHQINGPSKNTSNGSG